MRWSQNGVLGNGLTCLQAPILLTVTSLLLFFNSLIWLIDWLVFYAAFNIYFNHITVITHIFIHLALKCLAQGHFHEKKKNFKMRDNAVLDMFKPQTSASGISVDKNVVYEKKLPCALITATGCQYLSTHSRPWELQINFQLSPFLLVVV